MTSKEADISQGLINIFKNANQDALKQFLTDHKHDWIGIQNEVRVDGHPGKACIYSVCVD